MFCSPLLRKGTWGLLSAGKPHSHSNQCRADIDQQSQRQNLLTGIKSNYFLSSYVFLLEFLEVTDTTGVEHALGAAALLLLSLAPTAAPYPKEGLRPCARFACILQPFAFSLAELPLILEALFPLSKVCAGLVSLSWRDVASLWNLFTGLFPTSINETLEAVQVPFSFPTLPVASVWDLRN